MSNTDTVGEELDRAEHRDLQIGGGDLIRIVSIRELKYGKDTL